MALTSGMSVKSCKLIRGELLAVNTAPSRHMHLDQDMLSPTRHKIISALRGHLAFGPLCSVLAHWNTSPAKRKIR